MAANRIITKTPRNPHTLTHSKTFLRPIEFLVSLHVFLPLLGLAILYSFFHVDRAEAARLSAWWWLLFHGILGLLLGLMMYWLLKPRMSDNERLLLILGGISFSAGIAGYLHLSPIVVCFLAGIVFANMPGFNNILMEVILRHAERPIYFVMLVMAGSLWDFGKVGGWGFLGVFVMIRFAAKAVAFWAVKKTERAFRYSLLGSVIAQGPLAIAFVLGYEQRYSNELLPYIVTAILGGAIVNELISGKLMGLSMEGRDKILKDKEAPHGC